MSTARTPDERRTDAALLLALWARCSQRPREDAGDKLRQMKLAFLAANGLATDGIRGLNLSFYRWTWGPMSNEVYDAWEALERVGLLESEEHFVFSRAGESLARDFYDDVLRDERNAPIRAVVDRIAGEWIEKPSTGPLLDAVYAMELTPIASDQRLPVREIRKGEELLVPVDPEVARSTLYVDRGWLETLALVLIPGAAVPIHAAVADFRAGRVHVA
jgi:hypothetical protein